MKATIRDKQVLNSIRSIDLVYYLKSFGWTKTRTTANKWSMWEKSDYEIALPLDSSLGDYALRISDVIKTLSIAEDRSELEIIADLHVSAADIIRIVYADSDINDGTIPIDDNTRFVEKARDLVLAGACAAIEKKAIFPKRKPNQVLEYLKKVRMGQTERGSYIVTIISPVAPELRMEEMGTLFEVEQPFERKVTSTLAKAIDAVKRASENAIATQDLHEFRNAIPFGISANLCDAIGGLSPSRECNQGLEIRFSWSRSQPNDAQAPSIITFQPDYMPIIEEAARVFRETSPREEFELRGPVVKLERDPGSPTGKITVFSFIDEHPRKIQIELDEAEYNKAAIAHTSKQIISCQGMLSREGRSYILNRPTPIQIETED